MSIAMVPEEPKKLHSEYNVACEMCQWAKCGVLTRKGAVARGTYHEQEHEGHKTFVWESIWA